MAPVQSLEGGTGLVAGQDDGQVLRALGADEILEPQRVHAEHVAIPKEKGEEPGRPWCGRARFAHQPRCRGRRPVDETAESLLAHGASIIGPEANGLQGVPGAIRLLRAPSRWGLMSQDVVGTLSLANVRLYQYAMAGQGASRQRSSAASCR